MKLRLPSLRQILDEIGQTFLRFPLVILDALAGTIAALVLVDYEGPAGPSILFNILLPAILGIPLLTAIAVTAEKHKWTNQLSLGMQGAGIILLVGYGVFVPSDLTNAPAIHVIRLLLLGAALHFFVSAAPFAGGTETNGFWNYNKTLLFRFLTGGLFSAVLFAGLALALAAFDNLFGMHVAPKRYFEIWLIICGIFNTWFFLSGIPLDLDALSASTEYPKALKVFTQSILFPLVIVYGIILYAYLAKILITWDWPKGWVSGLILGYSTAGIFSLLLLHPLRDQVENIWIRSVSRWFYTAMIPLVVMLFLAIWRRISEYGVTVDRYIAIVLGLWLSGMVLYFIISKAKNITFIPISLFLISFIVSFGPWGVFTISEKSQVERLKNLFLKNSIMVNGIAQKSQLAVPGSDSKEISAILSYLHDIHGYESIQPWFKESLREDSSATNGKYKDASLVTKLVGVEYSRSWQFANANFRTLSMDMEKAIRLDGYDRMIQSQFIGGIGITKELPGEGITYRFSAGMNSMTFIVHQPGNRIDSVQIDLHSFIEKLLEEEKESNLDKIPPEKMTVEKSSNGLRVGICLRQLHIQGHDKEMKPTSLEAAIFYKINLH